MVQVSQRSEGFPAGSGSPKAKPPGMSEHVHFGWRESTRLEIRYTGNLRGDLEGLPYLATVIKRQRQEHPGLLLLDTGDFSGQTRPGRHAGRPQVEVMNHLKFDATVPGRAEASDASTLGRMARLADFPFLASNWRGAGEGQTFHRVHRLRRADVEIALVGMAWPDPPQGLDLVAPEQALEQALEGLDLDQTVVVVLSQLGFAADRNLATGCPEIHVLLEGVPYTGFDQATQIGETLVVPAVVGSRLLGSLNLDLSGALEIRRDDPTS